MIDTVHTVTAYQDVMVVLVTAAVIVPLLQRLKISPVLGFLLAGAALGPHGLGVWAARSSVMEWITVTDEELLGAFGEWGVVFLLFLIGLELSLKRLITMRRLVFGMGGLQVAISAAVIGSAAYMLGASTTGATLIGLSLALSSTAVVVELLSQQQRLKTATGRASFAVLLFQDLAVIPVILLATVLAPSAVTGAVEGNVLWSVLWTFGQAALAIILIVLVGSMVLKPLFRLVAASHTAELFVAATLLVAVSSALVTASAGLSMALGGFVAGLLMSDTEFRRAVETILEPVKGILIGVFFFWVGMNIKVGDLISNPGPILAGVLALGLVKGAIVYGLMRMFGLQKPESLETAAVMAPGGEFAFIVIGSAMATGAVSAVNGSYVLALTSVSMALIPVFDAVGRRLAKLHVVDKERTDTALNLLPPVEALPKAIVIGFGRVGELVSDMLTRHRIEHVVTERQPSLVRNGRRDGRPVYYGEAKNTMFLEACGLKHAAAVIITIHAWNEVDDIVRAVRLARSDIVIVARSRDAAHAQHLYEVGVTDAVPETIEASLQLSEAALVGLGVPAGPVIASIHEKRDEFRAALQKAAGRAGRSETRGIRAKAASVKKQAG